MATINLSLLWPVSKSSPISQYFGENPGNYACFGLAGHNGIDFAVPVGTPVSAACSGKVESVGFDPGGYGNYVKINHIHFYTLYAHLEEYYFKPGQPVICGVMLGRSGNTGNSTGPHLHFELRIPGHGFPGYKDAVNPLPYLKGEITSTVCHPEHQSPASSLQGSEGSPPIDHEPPAADPAVLSCRTAPLYLATVNVKKLFIRTTPSTSRPAAGSLPYGITIAVYEMVERDGNTWARLGENLYIANIYKNSEYLILTKYPPAGPPLCWQDNEQGRDGKTSIHFASIKS